MDIRRVNRVVTAHRQTEGGGFVVRRPFPSVVDGRELEHIDPFLLLDEMGPADYGPGEAIGAPDHPHRGFETVTYVLEGSVEHRDSTGAVGVIGPGAVQWMTAGSGIVHSEMPTGGIPERGGRMHGFQLWVNLRARDKMISPRYQGFEADDLGVVDTPGGSRLRVIAGEVAGAAGPVETTSPVTFAHVTVAAGDSIEWDVDEGHTALVHVFDGAADVNGTVAHAGQLVELEHDGGGVIVSSADGAEVLLLGGEPLREPISRYGPFVMNTRNEIVHAVEDFQAGRLGSIPAPGSGVVREPDGATRLADRMSSIFLDRLTRARATMADLGVDVLLVSVGHDLPYLTGYYAMPLERLTMLVVPRDGDATLVVPRLEAPRVREQPGAFHLHPWGETEDPTEIVARLVGAARHIAVGDQMWARFLVELLPQLPGATYRRAVDVVGPLRIVKDAAEIDALAAAGAAVDRIAAQLQAGEIPLVGRTEAEVSAEIGARIVAGGHDKVNFAIVAAGENAASPHHHAGSRVIRKDEIVLFDFGGTMTGYCSDTTRCVFTGDVAPDVAEAYDVLQVAQRAAVAAATIGTPCEDVDRTARQIIADAGYGEYFVHRTGHGIGMEEHEEPYIVEGNTRPLIAGYAFSIEPGIYMPGRWGMRLEDIVVATPDGPLAVNTSDHGLASV